MSADVDISPVETKGIDAASTSPEKMTDEILQALLDTIAPVSEKSNKIKALFYGDFGVGKTCFAASSPNPMVIDFEQSSFSLGNHPEFREVPVMTCKSYKQMNYLADKIEEGHFKEIETFICDTFSELQNIDLDAIVKKAALTDASRNEFLPIGPDYNENTERMRQLARRFRDMDKHFIMLTHFKEEKEEATGRLYVRPNLTPKLSGTIGRMTHIIGYMTATGEGETRRRLMQTQPTEKVTAKSRIGGLPNVLINATFEDILKARRAMFTPK